MHHLHSLEVLPQHDQETPRYEGPGDDVERFRQQHLLEGEVSDCAGALPLQLHKKNACEQSAHLVKYCLSEPEEKDRERYREREIKR